MGGHLFIGSCSTEFLLLFPALKFLIQNHHGISSITQEVYPRKILLGHWAKVWWVPLSAFQSQELPAEVTELKLISSFCCSGWTTNELCSSVHQPLLHILCQTPSWWNDGLLYHQATHPQSRRLSGNLSVAVQLRGGEIRGKRNPSWHFNYVLFLLPRKQLRVFWINNLSLTMKYLHLKCFSLSRIKGKLNIQFISSRRSLEWIFTIPMNFLISKSSEEFGIPFLESYFCILIRFGNASLGKGDEGKLQVGWLAQEQLLNHSQFHGEISWCEFPFGTSSAMSWVQQIESVSIHSISELKRSQKLLRTHSLVLRMVQWEYKKPRPYQGVTNWVMCCVEVQSSKNNPNGSAIKIIKLTCIDQRQEKEHPQDE